jgi:hypothetical protein
MKAGASITGRHASSESRLWRSIMLAALSWLLIALEICTSVPRGLKSDSLILQRACHAPVEQKNIPANFYLSVYQRIIDKLSSVTDPLMHRFLQRKGYQ